MTVILEVNKSRIPARNTSTTYSLILKLFFVLFLLTNVLLFYYLYEKNEPQCLQEGTCRITKRPQTLPREKWGHTLYFKVLLDNFRRINNEWRLIPRSNSSVVPDIPGDLNCSTVKYIREMKFIAAGWTKSTYKVTLNDNTTLSMKTVNIDGHDISSCLHEENRYLYDCFLISASKLLREISVLRTISHPNIVQVHKIIFYLYRETSIIEGTLTF